MTLQMHVYNWSC